MSAARQVSVGGVTLDCRHAGEGEPLLFLHGEEGLLDLDPVLEQLGRSFDVHAPHHPGWGDSERPDWIVATRDIARLYAELLRRFDRPPVVVGCSFGGWIAAELAGIAPDLISALVLVAPIGLKLGDREEREFADIWMASPAELREIFYRGDTPPPAERSDEDWVYIARSQEATARYGWQPYMHDPNLGPWLRLIDKPTLLVAADEDRFALLPDYYERYAARLGALGADLRTIDGSGHRIEEEAPDRLAQLVDEFVAANGADLPKMGAR